ncbi:MAG: pyridoxamine 5'-phosphate oxidase family protein [Pseudomonadales bacterium]|jgi:nitroimidazol reductase NimA-like FMN-containing flavoprotein (pyridoxamine 5'-phosphate oxidase superfamily)|nr:pyridoxamine 5'-phosphate oxidase family protein [Pseudomonadales bacterium]
MPLSRKLALDDTQIEEIMTTCWNCRIATIGPANRINLTPMWFGWAGGKIYIYGRGQKVVNLRRDPTCTIIVDRNEKFPELQAVMLQGQAQVLEDADAENADSHLAEARIQMGRKYNGGHGQPAVQDPPPNNASARGANGRWMVFSPDVQITWDNFKLASLGR